MSTGPHVIEVTEATFQADVIEASHRAPVVVDLWASWCGPCRTLGPILERIAGERQGAFTLAKVDVDANPAIAQAFGVQSIPTVVAMRDGQPVDAFIGALPEPEVQRFIDRLLPTEADLDAARAADAAVAGDLTAAEADYRRALEADGGNMAAALGLAELLVARGDLEEAERLATPLRPDPRAEAVLATIRVARWADDEGATPLCAARRDAARGEFATALEAMLALVHDEPEARASMLDVFAALGEDPLVGEYRRRLTNALF